MEITRKMLKENTIVKFVSVNKGMDIEKSRDVIVEYVCDKYGTPLLAFGYFCELDDEKGFFVPYSMLEAEEYNISLGVFKHIAMGNTKKKYPLSHKLALFGFGEDGLKILTSEKNVYGAYALFDNDFLMKVADRYNDDLFIIPSSIHELIVLPKSECALTELVEMVREVNNTVLEADELLSYTVFEFDRKLGKVANFNYTY